MNDNEQLTDYLNPLNALPNEGENVPDWVTKEWEAAYDRAISIQQPPESHRVRIDFDAVAVDAAIGTMRAAVEDGKASRDEAVDELIKATIRTAKFSFVSDNAEPSR